MRGKDPLDSRAFERDVFKVLWDLGGLPALCVCGLVLLFVSVLGRGVLRRERADNK